MTPMPEDEFDVPYGDLPTFGRIRLSQNHIVVVNAEARFVRESPGLSEAEAKKIWKKLGIDAYPYFEKTEQNNVSLVLTPEGTKESKQVVTGWVISDAEKSVSIILMPTLVNMQVLKYVGFTESLAIPFNTAIAAYAAATKSSIIQRIGLRYVNRLADFKAVEPTFWAPSMREGFAGPIGSELSRFITGSHQEVQMKLSDSASAIVHSGVFKDTVTGGAYSFLVDIDVFNEHTLDYSPSMFEKIVRKLNRTAYAVFDQMLTPEYIQQLGVEAREEGVNK